MFFEEFRQWVVGGFSQRKSNVQIQKNGSILQKYGRARETVNQIASRETTKQLTTRETR